MKQIKVKSGEKAPFSGIYQAAGSKFQSTFDKGERVTPNNEGKLQRWTLKHKTKHKDD